MNHSITILLLLNLGYSALNAGHKIAIWVFMFFAIVELISLAIETFSGE